MNRAAFGFAALAWMTAAASAAQVRQDAFGCKSQAAAERLMKLRRTADPDSYQDSLARQIGLGECRLWTAGEQVAPDDEDAGLVCFKPKGVRGTCYWSERTLAE